MLRMEAGENPRDVFSSMQQEIEDAANGVGTGDDPAGSAPPPTDPRLLEEVEPLEVRTGDGGEPITAQILRQLKGKTALSFLLEYYPDEAGRRVTVPREKAPLYKILNALKSAGYRWELSGDVVRIRPEDWAVRRSFDIPESFMEPYRRFLKEGGVPGLETLAEIADALTDGQIRHRFLRDPVLEAFSPGLASHVTGNRALLRWYAGMSAAEKARAETPQGLPFSDLAPEEERRLADFLESETGKRGTGQGRITLKVVPASPVPVTPAGEGQGKRGGESGRKPETVDRRAVFTVTLEEGEGRKPLTLERTVELPGPAAIRRLRATAPAEGGSKAGEGVGR
jgi:hypothetical protein